MEPINNFKGASSYEEADRTIFFGRKEEINGLQQQVKLNNLTLFFGKSGLGKTSLLKAGLFPEIRNQGYAPIFIRPNYSSNEDFIEYTYSQIIHFVKTNESLDYSLIREKDKSETIWEYLHNKPIRHQNELVIPILVFDQFEEIFTLGQDRDTNQYRPNVINFLVFLSEIVENAVPLGFGDKTLLSDDERNQLFLKYGRSTEFVKVIFSFREEYLSRIYDLSDRMPSLVNSFLHFRLDFLNYNNAYEVIKNAGSPYFDENAILKTLRLLTNSDSDLIAQSKTVESFMLSTYCAYEFEKQIKTINSRINESLLTPSELDSLVERLFYKGTSILTKGEWRWFRELVTEKGNRMPLNLNEAVEQNLISLAKIDQLINTRLLRKVNYNNQPCIELIHDRFAGILKRDNDGHKKRKKLRLYSILVVGALIIVIIILIVKNQGSQLEQLKQKATIDSLEKVRLKTEAKVQRDQDSVNAVIRSNEFLKRLKEKNDSTENITRSSNQRIAEMARKNLELDRILNNTGSELEQLKIKIQIAQNESSKQAEELNLKQRTINTLEQNLSAEQEKRTQTVSELTTNIAKVVELTSRVSDLNRNSAVLEREVIVSTRLVDNYFNTIKFDTLYDKEEHNKIFEILNLNKSRFSSFQANQITVYYSTVPNQLEQVKSKLETLGLKVNYSTNSKQVNSAPRNVILYFTDADFIKAFLLKEQLLPLKLQIRDGRNLKTSLNSKDIAIVL